MSDNASEFRSATFQQTIAKLGARHRFIRAGRPRPTGAWSGCNRPSWRSAGSPPCPLPHPQADRPAARSGALAPLLQHRTGPHRQVDQRANPRRRPRTGQAVAQEPMIRRHISGTGHSSRVTRYEPAASHPTVGPWCR
jgi:hypothetical protein